MPKVRPAKSARPPGRKPPVQKDGRAEKLTKEEKAVVKYLYNNVEKKKASMYGNNKLYFCGAKAVTCLMESKFASGSASDSLFNNRKMAVEFCQNLLMKNQFHHVFKIVKKQKPRVKEKDKESAKEESSSKSKSSKKSCTDIVPTETAAGDVETNPVLHKRKGKKVESADKKEEKGKSEDSKSGQKSPRSGDGDEKTEPQKKKVKGKVHLELNPNQTFFDDAKAHYVWVYESNSIWKSLVGGGLIVGSIAICLFPLWPEWLRYVAWYATSSIAMGLLGLLFGLALTRLLLYALVFGCTRGTCRFWLFPNLFAEVGFFESFVPYYESKWLDPAEEKKKKQRQQQKEKDKQSSEEEDAEDRDEEDEEDSEGVAEGAENEERHTDLENVEGDTLGVGASKDVSSEGEGSSTADGDTRQRNEQDDDKLAVASKEASSTGSNDDNDFELLEAQSL